MCHRPIYWRWSPCAKQHPIGNTMDILFSARVANEDCFASSNVQHEAYTCQITYWAAKSFATSSNEICR